MPAKIERLEARVSKEQKRLFQKAADLEGRTLTDFMIQATSEAARQTLERHEMVRLTLRDQLAFVKALLRPPEPGNRLRGAALRYKSLNQST